MADKMYLYMWKGDFGLATLELESLQVLTYCKLANVPVNVIHRSMPVWNCGWKMPIFQHNSVQLSGARDIIKYLRCQNYDPDVNLTPIQCSETLAFINMLDSKLRPAIQFLWWLDTQNFEGLTRKWYWHLIPFPLSYFYVNSRKANAELCSDSIFLMDDDIEVRKTALLKSCTECFEVISTKLKDKESFLYGSNASYADVVLYSHLAPVLKIPFPSDQLKRVLIQYTDIVQYIDRLSKCFYPSCSYEDRFGIWKQQTDVDTESLSRTNIMMSIAMVSVTMVAYGVSNGIIQLPKSLGRFLR